MVRKNQNKIKINLPLENSERKVFVPKTGVEPARLAALAPETSLSTISTLGQRGRKFMKVFRTTPKNQTKILNVFLYFFPQQTVYCVFLSPNSIL